MLSPEVWNFPQPKVVTSCKKYDDLESTLKRVKMNNFYKSLVITCPDEVFTPSSISKLVSQDLDYYKISDISLTEFLEPAFVENFVKSGKLYCLTADRNCIVDNCAAVTPDGMLTIHVLDFIYQTLGLQGTKRPHSFYELKIDLINLKSSVKVRRALEKLEKFDFYVMWEPDREQICPSSIAKYFHDKNVTVSLCTQEFKKLSPHVIEIPSIKDVDVDEMVEWIGLLALEVEMNQKESYISTYSPPTSEYAIKSNRISLLIVKGLLTPSIICDVCKNVSEFAMSRDIDNYWASVSAQSHEDSVWQWSMSSPKMFQAHNSSTSIFFSEYANTVYTVGELKFT